MRMTLENNSSVMDIVWTREFHVRLGVEIHWFVADKVIAVDPGVWFLH